MQAAKRVNEAAVTVSFTAQEALEFKSYMEHKDSIDTMVKAGVFNMRRGSVEIHFSHEGEIGAIIGHPMLYQKERVVVVT